MSFVRKLAGQTAIYGIPSIVGRLINFLLVFLFTQYFVPEIFAAHTEFYAYAAFFLVLIPHGMETAFFNFMRRDEQLAKVFTTSIISVAVISLLFLLVIALNASEIALFMGYPDHPEYVNWFAVILFFDVMAMIPFALLRHLQKAKTFALIRSIGIALNIALNLLFIVFFPRWFSGPSLFYEPSIGIGYVFIANLISSGVMFLMLVPQSFRHIGAFDLNLWKGMMKYAWPLVFVGLAGIVNETFDRVVMDKLLPDASRKFDIGVYGAFYKLSIIVTIFIQAFRYAAEPFFFERAKNEDAKSVYATVMTYFIAVCLFISLGTLLFLDVIAPLAIRQQAYFDHPDGMTIVPILLMANVFLGAVYNLSIWYKVKERTDLGAWISIGGALITIALLILFVPVYGFIAAAYTTLIVYGLMAVASFWIGSKYYPVPYELGKIFLMFLGASIIYLVDKQLFNTGIEPHSIFELSLRSIMMKLGMILAYMLLLYRVVIGRKKP